MVTMADELNFPFDPLSNNAINKCEPCNMFVPSLAEYFQLRHKKSINDHFNYVGIDDGIGFSTPSQT